MNFDASDVQEWDAGRFALVRTIQTAHRNRGHVHQMFDRYYGQQVAVKQMPNEWVCKAHDDFVKKYTHERELPWVDIGCTYFLNSIGYPYCCQMQGVFRSLEHTFVVSELALDGDLFGWSAACPEEPGPEREALVLPLARQVLDAVRLLHDLSIVHRDLSAENVLLSRRPRDGVLHIQLIDFAMATTERYATASEWGKPSYQAPEAHSGRVIDGFLLDTFAIGVMLYGLLVQEYPWISTQPGKCRAFECFQRRGFRELVQRRKRFQRQRSVLDCLSPPLLQLLEGLLALDPAERLTLGEVAGFENGEHGSVWLEPWVQGEWLAPHA